MVVVTMPLGVWVALLPLIISCRIARWTLRVTASVALQATRLAVHRMARHAKDAA